MGKQKGAGHIYNFLIMGFKAFSLCMMSILVYVLYLFGLKVVMPIDKKEKGEKGNEK